MLLPRGRIGRGAATVSMSASRKLLTFSAVLTSAASLTLHAQEVRSVGPWRLGFLSNKFDNVKIELATNPEDTNLGRFTFGYRCEAGKYITVLVAKDLHIFTKNSKYQVGYRFNDTDKRVARARAFTDSGLAFLDQIPVQALFGKKELILRVTADDGEAYDSSFALSSSDSALNDFGLRCSPDD